MARKSERIIDVPTRRDILIKGAAGALALAGLGMRGPTVLGWNMIDPTPAETEGPYWVDELLNRSDIRVDPATGQTQVGLPMTLAINVSSLSNNVITPLPGAYVDIWHCNALGIYSDIASEGTTGHKFLRGYQVTNTHGNVQFVTVYPGWYISRTVHIHFRVRLYNAATNAVTYNFTSQLFFADTVTNDVYANVAPYTERPNRDTTNAADSVYNTPVTYNGVTQPAGNDLLLRLFENQTHATSSFNVILDLTNGGGSGGPPTGGGPPNGGTPPTGGGTPPTGSIARSSVRSLRARRAK
jgi:protocatechuate 3,4-dioxygenase beta subunit